MAKYVILIFLIIFYIIIFNLGLDMINAANTIENLIGLGVIIAPILIVNKTKLISKILNKKKHEK